MISSRAFSPRVALGVTAVNEFLGPLIFGVAVATTIGHDIVSAEAVNTQVVVAALASAIIWDLVTWYLGFPSSSSHALIGGVIGSVVVGAGWSKIRIIGLAKVLLPLLVSPFLGFVFGFIILRITLFAARNATPKVNLLFKRSQIVTAVGLALSHGSNDAPKSMGLITLALVTSGYLKTFAVPFWVILLCAAAIAIGTGMGGWRLIRTVGGKFYRIRPVDGFGAQLSSAVVILGGSLIGGPVSTTQVVSSAVMGVGTADRANKVRWKVAQDVMAAWVLTVPIAAVLAGGLYWVIIQIFP